MIRTRSRFFCLSFCVLTLLLSATMSFGATWYVDNDGDDGWADTEAAPYETIQHAMDNSSDGDTVMVEAGSYSGDISIDSDGIILESVSGAETTIIDGGGNNNVISAHGNGVTIKGFRFKNANYGIQVTDVQTADVTIASNIIDDMPHAGITWGQDIQGCSVDISDNTLTGCTDGICLEVDMGEDDKPVNIRIVDNTITGSTSDGISFYDLYSGTVEISDNTLTNCTGYGIHIGETGYDGKAVSFKVQRNTITLSGDATGFYGIYMYSAERTTWITDNVISGDYGDGIYVEYVGDDGAESVLFYVEDNVITGCDDGIYLENVFEDTDGAVTLRNNTISEAERYGVYIENLGYFDDAEGFTFTFEDNLVFQGEGTGIHFSHLFYAATGTVSLRGNSFLSNDDGIYIEGIEELDGSTLTIEDNNFEGNDGYGLYNGTSNLIDATNNWWGDDRGPYHYTTNTDSDGDEVSDYVDYDGWRETPYIGGDDSSSGCAVGGFSPAMLLLALPLAGLFRRK